MFSEEEREVLKRRWESAQRKGNESDFEKAEIMKVIWDRYNRSVEGFRGEIRDGWRIYDNQKIKSMIRLARSITSVPDRDLWLAIGATPCAWLMENMNPEHYRFLAEKIRTKASANNGIVRGAEAFVDTVLIDAETPRPRKIRSGEDKELAKKTRRFIKAVTNRLGEEGVLHMIRDDQLALQLFNEYRPRRRMRATAS